MPPWQTLGGGPVLSGGGAARVNAPPPRPHSRGFSGGGPHLSGGGQEDPPRVAHGHCIGRLLPRALGAGARATSLSMARPPSSTAMLWATPPPPPHATEHCPLKYTRRRGAEAPAAADQACYNAS